MLKTKIRMTIVNGKSVIRSNLSIEQSSKGLARFVFMDVFNDTKMGYRLEPYLTTWYIVKLPAKSSHNMRDDLKQNVSGD